MTTTFIFICKLCKLEITVFLLKQFHKAIRRYYNFHLLPYDKHYSDCPLLVQILRLSLDMVFNSVWNQQYFSINFVCYKILNSCQTSLFLSLLVGVRPQSHLHTEYTTYAGLCFSKTVRTSNCSHEYYSIKTHVQFLFHLQRQRNTFCQARSPICLVKHMKRYFI